MNAHTDQKFFQIAKGVPLPARRGGGMPAVYPFSEMEVGDSFDAPRDMGTRGAGDVRQNTVSSCARVFAKRHNPAAKFTVRLVDDNTVRCWRVA